MSRLFDRPIAHRGLHDAAAGIVENSRSAFEAAVAAGYAIECDVQLSRDGVPFIFHDDEFDRLTAATGASNAKPIAEVETLALRGSRAGDRPTRFTDLLALVAGRTLLQIELKQQENAGLTATLAAAVAEALRGYRGACTLESFDPHLLVALRRERLGVPLGIVTYGFDEPEWDAHVKPWQRVVLRHLLHWPWTRFDFISCRDVSLGLPAVRCFRALGMPVTSWTITSDAGAHAALRAADQIVFEGFRPAIA
jgi:glycerophosphoryl diester phosphodiesterase